MGNILITEQMPASQQGLYSWIYLIREASGFQSSESTEEDHATIVNAHMSERNTIEYCNCNYLIGPDI
jgi:hypothetical protein